MFIGREREMGTLERLYQSDAFEFVVIYGRRRVGKTTLISEFIKDKKAVFYPGIDSNETAVKAIQLKSDGKVTWSKADDLPITEAGTYVLTYDLDADKLTAVKK